MNTHVTDAKRTGDNGEQLACTWLLDHGFEIISRNVHNRFGEIDIIARKTNTIHFVEVKTRVKNSRGFGVDAALGKKLSRSMRCAQVLATEKFPSSPFCLDILSIDGEQIHFFENITV